MASLVAAVLTYPSVGAATQGPARAVRLLSLKPVPAIACDSSRTADAVSFGPEAPTGFISASLDGKDADPTPLFLAVETKSGEYRSRSPVQADDRAGRVEFQAVIASGALVLGFVWDYGPAPRMCNYGFSTCYLMAGDVPVCTPPRLVAERRDCPEIGTSSSWLQVGAGGKASLLGDPISWDQTLAQPLAGPLRPRENASWHRAGWVDFSPYPGFTGFDLADTANGHGYRVGIGTDGGCFSDGRSVTPVGAGWRREEVSGAAVLDVQVLGKILLATWSWGVGVIDPPDSTYVPCRHALMACVLGKDKRPLCTRPQVVAKARNCRTSVLVDELGWKVPPARLLPDGRTFELYHVRYRVSTSPR